MKIGRTDTGAEAYIIAEIGGNHGGSPEQAHALVEAAAKAGANAVKFQTYRAEHLVHPSVEIPPSANQPFATQLEKFRALELEWPVYEALFAQCAELGVDFLTTPFDPDIVDRFAPHMPAVKIASGDLTFRQLVRKAASTGLPVLLSTGASTLEEIAVAVADIPEANRAILHCVSLYPLPDAAVNLRAIDALAEAFPDATIGYSDHTIGCEAIVAAAARGARVIEKHFTLDKTQRPGDHILSAEPDELAAAIAMIRRIEAMLGDGVKRPAEGEDAMRPLIRRGVYARNDIAAGEPVGEKDLLIVRPVSELNPAEADGLIGRPAKRELPALGALRRSDLSE